MLLRMEVKKFTVFHDEGFDFSQRLNVIIGENSTGKSHILKLAYALIAASAEAGKKQMQADPTKSVLQKAYGEKLRGVFRPESLGRLVSRKQGRDRCEVSLSFGQQELETRISFATNAQTDVQVETLPLTWSTRSPLYLPTRELLTIFPGFVSLYENHYLPFEETWRDTCIHLGALPLRGPRSDETATLLAPIEDALRGRVVLDGNGSFYLSIPGSGNMEMSLVAEGLRKLAMLARLISNGVVQAQGYVFWDEPEANLNPRLIKLVAQVIHELSARDVQVFIATHSLFLLRELEILQAGEKGARFFNLTREPSGICMAQGDQLDEIGDLVALDEGLQQSDRYLALEY